MATGHARERFKAVAQHLFAERGIDAVPVRDILVAAGQRSGGTLAYYFGTKEALIRELIVDGAKAIDRRRNSLLDRLEEDGPPIAVRQVVDILVHSSADLQSGDADNDYMRFTALLQLHHRQLFLDALEQKWNSGYVRCLDHLRRLLANLPSEIVNQRLIFLSFYLRAVFAWREATPDGAAEIGPIRSRYATPQAIADGLQGLLEQPMSEQTRAATAR